MKGIYINTGKELTVNKNIIEYNYRKCSEYVYPVGAHAGAPAIPIVKPGQYVNAGEIIAQADKGISACVCSSVSGKVTAIEKRLMPDGRKGLSIVVNNDSRDRRTDKIHISNSIIDTIKNTGIIGMGGAGFPAWIKYSPNNSDNIRYVIANGAECEPYITADVSMMEEEPEKVIEGLYILLELFPDAEGIIAIEKGSNGAEGALRNAILNSGNKKMSERIRLKILGNRYPQGAEKKLIRSVAGIKVSSSMLPSAVGCIVANVHTLRAVCNAINDNINIDRVVTVTGEGIRNPGNYLVRYGTPLKNLIEEAGGCKNGNVEIIAGGPMMGQRVVDISAPVTAVISGIVCLDSRVFSAGDITGTPCIRCGKCIAVCPSGLYPVREEPSRECIGCGCCSYICPARRELTWSMKIKRNGK